MAASQQLRSTGDGFSNGGRREEPWEQGRGTQAHPRAPGASHSTRHVSGGLERKGPEVRERRSKRPARSWDRAVAPNEAAAYYVLPASLPHRELEVCWGCKHACVRRAPGAHTRVKRAGHMRASGRRAYVRMGRVRACNVPPRHETCVSPPRSSHFFHELTRFVLLIVAALLEANKSGLLQLKADKERFLCFLTSKLISPFKLKADAWHLRK